jgi:hypothetical protein
MQAQILSISSMSRTSHHSWEEEVSIAGFRKALKALDALMAYHGWERTQ